MADRQQIRPDIGFIRRMQELGGESLKACYQCSTCTAVCTLSPEDGPFPRKEMLWAQWGLKDRLLADPDIWLCHRCNDCTRYCPRGARPGDVLAAARSCVFETYAFPSFMGRALRNPRALPFLLLVPVIVLGLILLVRTGGELSFLGHGPVLFSKMFPHGVLEAMFITGNVLIFAIAALGLYRFWRAMEAADGTPAKISFLRALAYTAGDIFSHRRFAECGQNRPRYFAHMLVLYGFLGAMLTAGLAVLFTEIIPTYELPLEATNPIKILGVLSGLAILVGGGIMIQRRITRADEVGANAYPDRLFLYVIFVVGLTGVLSWLSRLVGLPILAYLIYFAHLVLVFFLLWYMPYSKFAHVLYRTLALVYTRQRGRVPSRVAVPEPLGPPTRPETAPTPQRASA